MTVKQAASRLEASPSTVYALVAAGRLGHFRVGLGRGAIRITEDHISAFVAGKPVAAPPPPRRQVRLRRLEL